MQYFLALAEHLHFGQTAALLGITQPALSQQVQRLEEEFGAPLVQRTSRTIALTTAGRAIVDPLRSCVAAYDEARQAAKDSGQPSLDRLRIGFPGAEVGWSLLPALLRKLSDRLPATRIEVVEAPCQTQACDLRERRIDAGFMHLPVLEEGLGALRVRGDELVVLLPSNHPAASSGTVSVKELADEPFIDFRLPCPAYQQALASMLRKTGRAAQIEYGSTGLSTTIEMVASRLGVAIVTASAVEQTHPGITVRPLRPTSKPLDIAFVWQRDNRAPELRAAQFLIRELGLPAVRAARSPGQPNWRQPRLPTAV